MKYRLFTLNIVLALFIAASAFAAKPTVSIVSHKDGDVISSSSPVIVKLEAFDPDQTKGGNGILSCRLVVNGVSQEPNPNPRIPYEWDLGTLPVGEYELRAWAYSRDMDTETQKFQNARQTITISVTDEPLQSESTGSPSKKDKGLAQKAKDTAPNITEADDSPKNENANKATSDVSPKIHFTNPPGNIILIAGSTLPFPVTATTDSPSLESVLLSLSADGENWVEIGNISGATLGKKLFTWNRTDDSDGLLQEMQTGTYYLRISAVAANGQKPEGMVTITVVEGNRSSPAN